MGYPLNRHFMGSVYYGAQHELRRLLRKRRSTCGGPPTKRGAMAINIAGVVSVVIFYIIILAVGIWAGRKSKKTGNDPGDADEVMLAGRNIGVFVGIFTMTGE
ncbi:hypothetical protein HPB52_014969 [Rhipicephalus sanguineus]|uniref:Uncharacterized protein n=1 Tax=Rhipicephalus sanguineus TaxID=34632 RepID=A0A9D4TAN5_RHISA|nr:hypothetical protein HPB52_014969 [Rhipicephalus sanguineus]